MARTQGLGWSKWGSISYHPVSDNRGIFIPSKLSSFFPPCLSQRLPSLLLLASYWLSPGGQPKPWRMGTAANFRQVVSVISCQDYFQPGHRNLHNMTKLCYWNPGRRSTAARMARIAAFVRCRPSVGEWLHRPLPSRPTCFRINFSGFN